MPITATDYLTNAYNELGRQAPQGMRQPRAVGISRGLYEALRGEWGIVEDPNFQRVLFRGIEVRIDSHVARWRVETWYMDPVRVEEAPPLPPRWARARPPEPAPPDEEVWDVDFT